MTNPCHRNHSPRHRAVTIGWRASAPRQSRAPLPRLSSGGPNVNPPPCNHVDMDTNPETQSRRVKKRIRHMSRLNTKSLNVLNTFRSLSVVLTRSAVVLSVLMIGLPQSVQAADAAYPFSLTPGDLQSWPLVVQSLDSCVASIQLRGDVAPCRGLSEFLQSFAGRVILTGKAAAATPNSAPIQSQPAPEAPQTSPAPVNGG